MQKVTDLMQKTVHIPLFAVPPCNVLQDPCGMPQLFPAFFQEQGYPFPRQSRRLPQTGRTNQSPAAGTPCRMPATAKAAGCHPHPRPGHMPIIFFFSPCPQQAVHGILARPGQVHQDEHRKVNKRQLAAGNTPAVHPKEIKETRQLGYLSFVFHPVFYI